MTWVKLDTGFVRHPKVVGISDKALRLHIAALCHCGQYLTDGFISREAMASLARIMRSRKIFALANQLVSAGLWGIESDGFVIHDYLEYNPSKRETKRKQAEARARMRAIRSREHLTLGSLEHERNVRDKISTKENLTSKQAVSSYDANGAGLPESQTAKEVLGGERELLRGM